MNFIKKFYDADVAETGGAETVVEEQPLSGGAALAKFGQKSDENGFKPVNIQETKEVENPVVEEPHAATATETETIEKPTSETQVQEQEPEKAETPIAEQPAKVFSLEEVLKNNQPDTVLKALGFDDQKANFVSELKDTDPKLVGIMQAYKDGTLGDYIKELATDYSQMQPEDVMRHQLRADYPKATQRQLEILYKKEIIDAYNLDSDDEDEAAEGRELLAAKADKYRDSFIANQEKFLLPKTPEPKPAEQPDNSEQLQAEQRIEAYKKELLEAPFTKDIIANKKITLGEGEEKFSYPVDATSLVDILTDGGKWAENMWDATSQKPKIEHQLAVAAFALDSKKFLTEYAKHLKSLGAKQVIDPIDNASPPDKSQPAKSEAEPTTAAGNLARKGIRSDGS